MLRLFFYILMSIPAAGILGVLVTVYGILFHSGFWTMCGMAMVTLALVATAVGLAPLKVLVQNTFLGEYVQEGLAFPAMVLFFCSLWASLIIRTSAWESSILTRIFFIVPGILLVGVFACGLGKELKGIATRLVVLLARSLLVIAPMAFVWASLPTSIQAAGRNRFIRLQHQLIKETVTAVTFTSLAEYDTLVTNRFSPEDGTPQWLIGCANPHDERLPRLFHRDPADAIHNDPLCGATLRPLTNEEDANIKNTLKVIEEERRQRSEAEQQEQARRLAEARAAAAAATPIPTPTTEVAAPEPTPQVVIATPVPTPTTQATDPPTKHHVELSPEERARRKEILRREYERRHGRLDWDERYRRDRGRGQENWLDEREALPRRNQQLEEAQKTTPPDNPLNLSRRTEITFTLDAPISSEDNSAGQPFTGRLKKPILDGRTIIVDRGVRVNGHIQEIQRAYNIDDHPKVTLIVESIDGHHVSAEPLELRGASGRNKQVGDVAKSAGAGLAVGILEKILRKDTPNKSIPRDGAIGAGIGVVVASQRGTQELVIKTNQEVKVWILP